VPLRLSSHRRHCQYRAAIVGTSEQESEQEGEGSTVGAAEMPTVSRYLTVGQFREGKRRSPTLRPRARRLAPHAVTTSVSLPRGSTTARPESATPRADEEEGSG
jgi:hypothetical protein